MSIPEAIRVNRVLIEDTLQTRRIPVGGSPVGTITPILSQIACAVLLLGNNNVHDGRKFVSTTSDLFSRLLRPEIALQEVHGRWEKNGGLAPLLKFGN